MRLRTAAVIAGCLLVLAAAFAAVSLVLVELAPLTLAVAAALLFTALLSPVHGFLSRLKLPGWLAALTTVVLLLIVVLGPLALITNQAVAQFAAIEDQAVQGLDQVRQYLLAGPLTPAQFSSALDGLVEALRSSAPDPMSGAATAVQTLASMAIALVLLFFLLRDGPRMWQWFLTLVPAGDRRARVDFSARGGWETLVAYVRGTVVVAAIDAVGIGAALLVLDIPLALALAVLTFLLAFIPIVGAIIAGAAAVLVALVSNGMTDALLVLAAVLVVQQVESNVLQPFIMGKALRLHPAVVMLAVSTGTLVGGIAGAVVAVPITAVAYRVTERAFRYAAPESLPQRREQPELPAEAPGSTSAESRRWRPWPRRRPGRTESP